MYVDESFRKDRKVVLAAVKQNYNMFKYADESLRKDKKFILKCIKATKGKLEGIDVSLINDKDIQKAFQSFKTEKK